MSAAVRHLHSVDTESGEVFDACPACAVKDDEIEGLQRDIRGWAARYAELKRDREREAREHVLWPVALRLFRVYCQLTPRKDGKPRKLGWDADRFECVRPHLEKWGEEMCLRAIVGRVFDHHVSERRNGTPIHYYEWERIFGNAGKMTPAENFEESCKRAPADWRGRLPGKEAKAA